MTFGDRLNILIKALDCKSITSFEDKVGVSRKTFAKVIREGTDTGCKNILKIWENFPEVNLHWLITGEGQMFAELKNLTGYLNKETGSYLSEPSGEYGNNNEKYIKILIDQVTLLKAENENKQNIIDMFKRGDIIVTPKE